jgi:hypothetical protein
MMATTASKYNILNGVSISNSANTILFPSDLLSEGSNMTCLTLFVNTIKNGTTKLQLAGNTPATSATLNSAYGEIPVVHTMSRSLSSSQGTPFSNTYVRSPTTITLPMPNGLSFSSKTNWTKEEFKSTGGGIDQLNDLSNTMDGIGGLAKRLATSTIGSVAQGQGLGGAKDLVELGSASIANNYAETLFKGVDNRSFQWSWTLTPRNTTEAATLELLLRTLRFHQLPEYDQSVGNGNAFLLYPSSFDVSFWDNGAPNKFIPRISTCALVSMDTNYTPTGGNFIRMVDGSPQSYNLTITLSELQTLNKGMVANLDSSGTSF